MSNNIQCPPPLQEEPYLHTAHHSSMESPSRFCRAVRRSIFRKNLGHHHHHHSAVSLKSVHRWMGTTKPPSPFSSPQHLEHRNTWCSNGSSRRLQCANPLIGKLPHWRPRDKSPSASQFFSPKLIDMASARSWENARLLLLVGDDNRDDGLTNVQSGQRSHCLVPVLRLK